METIIIDIIVAISGAAVGFLAGFLALGRKKIVETENKIDDKILELIDKAIEESKKND